MHRSLLLFLPLFFLLMSCTMMDDDYLSASEGNSQLTSSDFRVENNQIVFRTNRDDALFRGITDSQYDRVFEMITQINSRINEYLMNYEDEYGSRSLPVYMAHGYLYSTTYGSPTHAGPVEVGYGDSFTVIAGYSGSNYMYGGNHLLKIEWMGGSQEHYHDGDGSVQYYFNNECGPVDLYYSYRCDYYTNSQCLWIVFGYFAD